MAQKDKTLLYVGLAGAAGFGLYMYLKGQYYTQVNTSMFGPGFTPSQPSFLELIFQAAGNKFAQERYFDDAMKMRGPAHYAAWQSAVQRAQINYVVGGVCFMTKDGIPCPV